MSGPISNNPAAGGVPIPGLQEGGHASESKAAGRRSSVGGQPVPTHPREVRAEGARTMAQNSPHRRRLSAVALGVATAAVALAKLVRGAVALGTVGISELAIRGASHLYNTHGTKPPPDTVNVNLPGGDSVTLSRAALPKRIPSGMSTDAFQEAIQGKVDEGHRLISELSTGTHDGSKCTVKDMTNIAFFLQAKGQSLRGEFQEGAFSIPDEGGNIRKFLDGCPEAYQRESSHIKDFQTKDGGRHRGIDAYGSGKNLDELLPNGMKTMLYGSMETDSDLKMPMHRLFVKLESHGAWLTSPKGGGDADGPRRFGNRHDPGAILGHSFSFLETRGAGSKAGTMKERIPDTVKNAYRDLIKRAPDNIKQTLEAGQALETGGGIRVMRANVEEALDNLGEDQQDLREQLTYFNTMVSRQHDNLDVRIGNEVILTAADLSPE